MNRLFFTTLSLLLLLLSTVTAQNQRSETVVFISGERFYVHRVLAGETLYSLAKLYDVTTSDIEDNNTIVKEDGLKEGKNIKIPITKKEAVTTEKESDKKLRKSFDLHIVEQGQTLYSISRNYEISVATIVEDNPHLDPSHLALGQKILIRKRAKGQSSEDEAIEQIGEYTAKLNRVAPAGYEYHVVAQRETLYTLLRRTGMSRREFLDVNPTYNGELRSGAIVLLRTTTVEEETETETETEELTQEADVRFSALRGDDTLDVSLLLPLSTLSGGVVSPLSEFYQGFLLGVEDLKNKGRNVRVNLFDTRRDVATVAEIVSSQEFQGSDLIVGPVYEDLLSGVIPFAQKRSIPVVSPLATLKDRQSGVVFQMAPVTEHRYDKIGDLFPDSVRITLIYTESVDTLFEAQVKELLGDREYAIHSYEYEHPSVIAERVREAKRLEMEEELEPSPSDMTPLIEGEGDSVLFIMSNNETDVDRILSAVVSAEISLRSRKQRVSNFRVLNNPQWNRYSNIDRAMLFRARVTAFSSYHAKRDAEVIKEFDSRYAEAFGAIPSLYSYRGYDVAMIFGEGMFSDIEYGMEGRTFTPLQTTYRFGRVRDGQSRANKNWMKVRYKPNFTITLE